MSASPAARVLAIVPARGGSKSIERKNLRLVGGVPLLGHAILCGLGAASVESVLTTTDDEEMATYALSLGSQVLERPACLAGDATPMLDVVRHALSSIDSGRCSYDCIALLQPTAPMRTAEHVENAVKLLVATPGADSVISVTPVPGHFHEKWQLAIEDSTLKCMNGRPLCELESRRQDLPPAYARNGAIYVFRRETLSVHGSIYGRKSTPYIMTPEQSVNVDDELDLIVADALWRSLHGLAVADNIRGHCGEGDS